MSLCWKQSLRFITSSEIHPPSEEELLPNQNMNTIQNISLSFDYTNSRSIPISTESSKNYNGNKYHPKNSGSPFPPPPSLSLALSIFNSPLRYFLHPSKAAVIINESLPVLSALCMRALLLKAEGNGGWTEGEGLRVTHAYTHIYTLPLRVTDLRPQSQKY